MAYLKRKRIRNGVYLYIVRSYRRQGKVKEKVLEYLGREPEPARLKKAMAYWGVKKRAKSVGRRRGKWTA